MFYLYIFLKRIRHFVLNTQLMLITEKLFDQIFVYSKKECKRSFKIVRDRNLYSHKTLYIYIYPLVYTNSQKYGLWVSIFKHIKNQGSNTRASFNVKKKKMG